MGTSTGKPLVGWLKPWFPMEFPSGPILNGGYWENETAQSGEHMGDDCYPRHCITFDPPSWQAFRNAYIRKTLLDYPEFVTKC